MRTFTHDSITYRLDRSQALVFEARKHFFTKFEAHPTGRGNGGANSDLKAIFHRILTV
jgi:hypothetical protein